MASSKNLATAVKKAVGHASQQAKTGNVSTSKAPPAPKEPAPVPTDLPTGAHSRR